MKAETLNGLLEKLKAACAKEPTAAQIDVLKESIIDNRLSDEEILRGYKASRDAEDPWWPKPGEFLARSRPPVSAPVIAWEAETIFQLILDHPSAYGTYSPENGMILDRRKVEAAHGRAAGEAFGSVQGRFRTMETLADEKWVRKGFCDAYVESRADHGAPLALTPPERRLFAPAPAKALIGTAEPAPLAAEDAVFQEVLKRVEPPPPMSQQDFESRRAELLRQAHELAKETST